VVSVVVFGGWVFVVVCCVGGCLSLLGVPASAGVYGVSRLGGWGGCGGGGGGGVGEEVRVGKEEWVGWHRREGDC